MTLTAIKPFREKVKGVLRFHPHIAQWKVWNSEKRFVFFLAGAQSGKTCFGPHWLKREIEMNGPGDYLAVTATYDLFNLKMLPELLKVFAEELKCGHYWAQTRVIELSENMEAGKFYQGLGGKQDGPMWGRIILRSAQSEGGLEAATALAAWLDEVGQPEFKREAWEATLRRLSLNQGRVLGTTTLYCMGWLKQEIYDKFLDGDPDIDIIQADSTVNPLFSQEEFERARKSLPAWKFNMFYRGIYDKPVGLVYDSFNEATCKIARFALPVGWPRYVGHDFGTANPAAMFYAQDTETGYFYAYDEYLPGTGKSVYQHIQTWKEKTSGLTVLKRVGGTRQEQEIRDAYMQQGWEIQEPMVKLVQSGIDRVYQLHKHNRIFVFSDLPNYLDEKTSYSWKLNDRHEATDEIADKARYHLMDAERYLMSDFFPESVGGQKRVARIIYY